MTISFHFKVCFLAEHKESYLVIGAQSVDAEDVGSNELEDEHDVVPFVEVLFLIVLN